MSTTVQPLHRVSAKAARDARSKIYPRLTRGRFNTIRVLTVLITQAVFFGLPWLQWNGRQAVLLDIDHERFYLFGLILGPQDLVYLAGLLIVSALGLFGWTALAGRLWCGNACPQTVYTEIMLWIERAVQGDRPARMRLDAAPRSWNTLWRKGLSHGLMMGFALLTGATFVGYFTPIQDIATSGSWFALGGWTQFWLLFYAVFTYVLAGLLREQVCKHMCPYARFQGAMFDDDTLIISYDPVRGEPRGSRKQGDKPRGDCVDCSICVQVCPTGIDIREGLQYECIGCAACIDACDTVMDKIGAPRGLIRFTSQNAMARGVGRLFGWKTLFRPRMVVYAVLMATVIGAMGIGLWQHQPYKFNVLRDRAFLSRETDDGLLENGFTLRVMNYGESAQDYRVEVEGLPSASVSTRPERIRVEANGDATVYAWVRADTADLPRGSHPFRFRLVPKQGEALETDASFIAE